MTDTPAESAEAPRTPEEWAAAYCKPNSWAEPIMAAAIRAALEARDRQWREAVRATLGDGMHGYLRDDVGSPLAALLSEGKPGK